MSKIVELKNIKKYFTVKDKLFKTAQIKAVDNVSFNIIKGETLGLVGESGCGKSTIGRLILRLINPTEGSMLYGNENILEYTGQKLKFLRKKMQIIFQDPFASLNPKLSIEEILSEPLIIHKTVSAVERKKEIIRLLEIVGLDNSAGSRYPHEFSGGQRQRISIARALSVNPEFIVADEPVSALDVSIQAQIINLMEDLQKRLHLTYLFISHDLAVVKHISDRIIVMYLGKIVESANSDNIFKNPLHPYTKALLSAIPQPEPNKDKEKEKIILPDYPADEATGQEVCRFYARCFQKKDICARLEPQLKEIKDGHFVACHLYQKTEDRGQK